jgi:hypothetical protein
MSVKFQRVTFANDITIIEFPMVIGDNPSVSSGAPVQIGWVPQTIITRNLDLYEHLRQFSRRPRRKELILKAPQRAAILLSAGYRPEEIAAASIKADLIRKSRIESLVLKKQGWVRFSTIPKGLVQSVKNNVVAPLRQRSVLAKTA